MAGAFGVEHISLGGPVFDTTKLDWLNGRYLREKLDDASFQERVRTWALADSYMERILPLARSRIERLSDLGPLLAHFFSGRLDVDPAALREGKLDDDSLRRGFVVASALFDAQPEWTVPLIEASIRRTSEILDKKLRDVVRPFYVAITGSAQSVPLFDSMQILGRDLVRERLRGALERLGGATAKEQEAWKKAVRVGPE
jgi:glutamyl-tRNA synthetase